MKTPFIDYLLYSNVLQATRTFDDNSIEVEAKRKVTRTYSRDTMIPPEFVGYTIAIHNGKRFTNVRITSNMIGYKLGTFCFTKRLGSSIHNSEHNAKKRAKMRRKITERKIRKTTVKKVTKASKTSGPQKVRKGTRNANKPSKR